MQLIGGENIIVEVDESKSRKSNCGHSVDGVWVVAMEEKTQQRRIGIIPLEKRYTKTLSKLLRLYVHPSSTIQFDCWKRYNRMKELFQQHFTVNHNQYFNDPGTEVHTNTI